MKKIVLFLSLLLTTLTLSIHAQVTVFSEGFEEGVLPAGWTAIDADNDGNNWVHNFTTYVDGHESDGAYLSFSRLNNAPLTPDNWLITPAITLTGPSTLDFWRMVGFSNPADHFGVFVSTTSATDLTSFTQVYEETPNSYQWAHRIVDLSAYSGSTVYIAFRHYNCTNQLALILDDITVTTTTASSIITAVPTALQFLDVPVGAPSAAQTVSVNGYNVAGPITATVGSPFEIATDNINYSGSATLSSTDTVLYVRYYPSSEGIDTAMLTLTDGTVSTQVILSGSSLSCDITLPYQQDFNSVPDNGLPACWSKINPFDGHPKVTGDYGLESGDKVLMFKCNYNTYEPQFAVMPPMSEDLSNLQISFYTFREGSWSGTLSVGYVTSPGDSSTFVPIWSINAAQLGDNNPHPFIVSFGDVGTDPFTQYYITFKYETSSNWYWFVDNITVEEIPNCGTPTNLTVNQITSTSATVNWDGNTDFYNLYYKTSYDTGWTEIASIASDSAGFLLQDLTPATDYTWYVASICDDGSTTNSLGTSSFTTECSTYIAPFTQTFDGSNNLPICWSRYSGLASTIFAGGTLTETTGGWNFSNTHVFGANHARINIYGTGTCGWLVTPPIDLSELTNPVLTFDLALTYYNTASPIASTTAQQDDKFLVIISTDFGATWSATNSIIWSNDSTADYVYNQIPATGDEVTLSLANYANQTVMIAFYGESTVTDNGDNDLHIDNVMVTNASSCAKPTALTVSAVTSNSVTLGWTENGTANSWNIEYGPSGYTQGSSSGTLVAASTNPFTIENLTPLTYDFYVQANCGEEQSFWAGPISVTPGAYNMGVSGSDTLTTCGVIIYDNGGASGNYSSSCNYTLVLYPETSGSSIAISGTYDTENNWDHLYIYDGAGTSGTELGHFTGSGTISTIVGSNGPLTIKFTSDGGINKSGFVLNVSCASCTPPGDLAISNLSATSADLTWTGVSTIYTVEYKAESDTTWISETLSDTTLTLAGLTPMTPYQVNVYGDCDGELSPAATLSFTTPMVAATLPFSSDFSDGSDPIWLFNNGNRTNRWKIGSISDDNNALFISSNNNTPGYNHSSFAVVTTEKVFVVGQAPELIISFDVKVGGEDEFDYMKVFFAPSDSLYPAASTDVAYANINFSQYAINFTDYLPYTGASNAYVFNLTNDSIIHVTAVMPNPVAVPDATSTAKLVFLWRNDTSGGEDPGAIIYNLSMEAAACSSPTDVAVSNLTTNSAVISWTPTGSEESWTFEYQELSETTWTSETVLNTPSFTMSNLLPGTAYQVRIQANCDNNEHSAWTNFTFSTPCESVTTFPYTEGFEHGGAMPDCWTQEYVVGSVNWSFQAGASASSGINNAHTGNYNACFYQNNDNGYTTRLVTPIFDLSNVTDPYLSFWYAMKAWGNDQDLLYLYYRTSLDDIWLPLTQYTSSVVEWTMDSIALPNPSATYQIAFVGTASYGHGIVLDDITVDGSAAPGPGPDTCVTPTGLHATSVEAHAISIEWDASTDAVEWHLRYRTQNDEWSTLTVSTNSNVLSNLENFTQYEIQVQANCGDGNLSDWSASIFATTTACDGIEEYLLNRISLFPNPAREYVDIRVDENLHVAALEVCDVYGKVVRTVNIVDNPTRINVNGLANGMYFVRVSTDAGVVTKSFVKQ